MRQVAHGDREAFHQLYLETNRSVYSFILSILKNPQDAEEVLQETYLKIWTSARSYKPQGKPLALSLIHIYRDFSGSAVTEIKPDDVGDKTFYARWLRNAVPVLPGDTVRYIVEHYKKADGGYTLADTEFFAGKIGTEVRCV